MKFTCFIMHKDWQIAKIHFIHVKFSLRVGDVWESMRGIAREDIGVMCSEKEHESLGSQAEFIERSSIHTCTTSRVTLKSIKHFLSIVYIICTYSKNCVIYNCLKLFWPLNFIHFNNRRIKLCLWNVTLVDSCPLFFKLAIPPSLTLVLYGNI